MTQPELRWTEIGVDADPLAVDDLVNLLNRHCTGGAVVEVPAPPLYGSGGTVLTDETAPAPQRVIVKGFLPVWDAEALRKLEIVLLLLSRNGDISEPRIRVLEPQDWAEAWKQFFPPQHIGEHLVIVPTWVAYEAGPGETILRLDPGMAFGTGLHASTRLCLLSIERLMRPGWRVLDVGTGSGILGIAAALQGACVVTAIDNDAVAVEVARQNAALNGVAGAIDARLATLPGPTARDVPIVESRAYDLVLINILAEVIIAMAAGVAASLRAGGRFVASGIIAPRADDVTAALGAAGLMVDERLLEDDWVALIGHRPGGSEG